VTSGSPRPPRLRSLPAELLDEVAATLPGTPDSELFDLLDDALAQLPSPERAAVMTAYGYGEGADAVAADLGLDHEGAEALSRNALQLLRAALAETEPDLRGRYPRHSTRKQRKNVRPPV
jgi:DNA-directed RNA polymerase specialized sigma24 family protein